VNLERIDLSLYAILDPDVQDECAIEDFVRLIIEGGTTSIQVRCKHSSDDATMDFTFKVLGVARPAGVPVIVNDRLEVALAARAEGVHLGEEDIPIAVARRRVAEAFEESAGGGAEEVAAGFIIGASARTLEAARMAAEAGAGYIGVGPMFSTPNKPGVAPVEPGIIRAMKREISLPIVAIGGITEENVHVPMSHGADGAAVITALRGTGSPREAAARLRAAIEKSREG
jgi:thiamine-phosphate pyrophosphorylase